MGILSIIALLLLIARFIFRKSFQGISSTSQQLSISQMKKKPQKAIDYAASLDMPFNKRKEINEYAFQLICTRLQSLPLLGKFKILYTQQIDATQLLVMTQLTYDDYEVDLKGKTYDAQKEAWHDFVFRHNTALNEMEVYSDLVTDATTKFQKQEFVQALFASEVSLTS